MNELTQDQINEHLITIRMHLDPDSPFQGKINFNDGLMALPIPQQEQIYNALPDDLRAMVEAPK